MNGFVSVIRLVSFLLLLGACTPMASKNDLLSVPDLSSVKGKEVVVFLHGYYGSALVDPQGKRQFLTVLPILFGHFKIGLDPEFLGLEAPELSAAGMISEFPVAPFYSIDVYGEGFRKLQQITEVVIPYHYDWRKDLTEVTKDFSLFLKKLESEEPRSIHLMGHSMGGLVATYAYVYGDQDPEKANALLPWSKVRTVTTLGTPFRGVMSILRNMQFGTGYPWNPALLQPETVASFPASYYLLPLLEAEFFVGDQKQSLPLKDAQFWKQHRLGLLRDPNQDTFEIRLQYTQERLKRAHSFQAALARIPKIPLLKVIGRGTPTLTYGEFRSPHDWAFRPKDTELFARLETDGDGTVPSISAMLDSHIPEKILDSTLSHDKLFLDPNFLSTFSEWKEKR